MTDVNRRTDISPFCFADTLPPGPTASVDFVGFTASTGFTLPNPAPVYVATLEDEARMADGVQALAIASASSNTSFLMQR